jgi:hypothetical protein
MYNFPMPTETLRAELAKSQAMIDAALRLHVPTSSNMDSYGNRLCAECSVGDYYQEYPCPTAKALGVIS